MKYNNKHLNKQQKEQSKMIKTNKSNKGSDWFKEYNKKKK